MESNMDIVTSYQGTDHITADQMADLQRGIFGGDCILPVGNKMKVNIQTANQITISDGVSVYDGREIYIAHGKSENVAITSGTQGMMRNDIVCIQYNRDEQTGIESVAPVVVAGTPVASDPQDPAYSNLDIRTGVFMSQKPFCRVRLNGTAIEAIDMLVEVFDKGIYYLPQLIASAEAMKASIDVLEPLLYQDGRRSVPGTIIAATVAGDIHDIGKKLSGLVAYGSHALYDVFDMLD